MGYKYEVYNWQENVYNGYALEYAQIYQGKSLLKVIFTMIHLKVSGAKCIKFEWR